ncbi:MAG: TonB-dependent receptor [Halioglobus sp.]|nr:TonB-dependent receptor [Halioglobus sp.]
MSIAVAGVALSTQVLSGQVMAQGGGMVLEEVIVTAQKRSELLSETPMTVNVMTGEQIEELASFNFSDLNNLTAGLAISGVGFDTNIATRGLGTELNAAVSPRVSAYLDGAFISQQRALFSGIYDMSQVQLLRGPQGTLYGQASPAGAITLQSRDPNLESFDGSIQQSFTDQDGFNTQVGVSLPLIKNVLGLRVSGLYDSNRSSDARNITLDKDLESETEAFRAVALWQPSDSFNLRIAYHDIQDDVDIDNVVKGNGIEFDDRISVADFDSVLDGDSDFTVLEANYAFNENLTATLVASLQDNVVTRTWDGDGSPVQGQEQFVRSEVTDLMNYEARLSSQGNDVWDWTVGAFYQDSESATPVLVNTYVSVGPGSSLLADTSGPALINTNTLGLFTHNSIHLSEKGTLTVGLRYIEDERFNRQTFSTVANFFAPDGSLVQPPVFSRVQEGVSPENQEDDDTAYTGTLKYQHELTDDLMGYVSYDRGWRAGSANIAGSPQPAIFGSFDAEESDNIELGSKWSILEGRGLLNMAVYYQIYTDFQYQAEVAFREAEGGTGLATPVVNVDEAEVYGFDADLSLLLLENWTASVALSYVKTELSDAQNVPCVDDAPIGGAPDSFNTCDLTGERAGNEPEWSANLFTEYFQPLGNDGEWYVRALVNSESEYYSASEQQDLDSYTTLDLFLGWRTTSRNIDARLWVKNAFDETAELNTERLPNVPDYDNGGEVETGLTWVRRQLDPRTLGMTITYNF